MKKGATAVMNISVLVNDLPQQDVDDQIDRWQELSDNIADLLQQATGTVCAIDIDWDVIE